MRKQERPTGAGGVARPDWTDGQPIAKANVPALQRDERGRLVRPDWTGEPPVSHEQRWSNGADLEGQRISQEVAAAYERVPYNELAPEVQADVGGIEGYNRVTATDDHMRQAMGVEYGAFSSLLGALPESVQSGVRQMIGSEHVRDVHDLLYVIENSGSFSEAEQTVVAGVLSQLTPTQKQALLNWRR